MGSLGLIKFSDSKISHPTLRQMGFAMFLRLHGGTSPGRNRSSGRIAGLFTFGFVVFHRSGSDKIIIVSVALSILNVYGVKLLPLEVIILNGRSDFPLAF